MGWVLIAFVGLHFILDETDHREELFVTRFSGAPMTKSRRVAALFSLLGVTVDMFDGAGIEYWIEAGALLGSLRNGALIPWDVDLDVGMMDPGIERLRTGTATELPLPAWAKLEVVDSKSHPDTEGSGRHISTIVARIIDTRSGVYIDVFRYFPLELKAEAESGLLVERVASQAIKSTIALCFMRLIACDSSLPHGDSENPSTARRAQRSARLKSWHSGRAQTGTN